MHVDGGAFGMLIIDPASNNTDNSPVAQWLTNERKLLLSDSVAGLRANGKSSEVVEMKADEWYYFRIGSADGAARNRLVLIGEGCEARAVAYDGVWRTTVPHPTASSRFKLSGSSRLDLAVKCSGNSGLWYKTKRTRGSPLVNLKVVGGTKTAASPWKGGITGTGWEPDRPDYLASLPGQPTQDTYSITMSGGQINGQKWDPDVPLSRNGGFQLNDLEEWNIGGSRAHPFHIHLYHMQVITPGGCPPHEEGQFFDTISSSTACTVRFKLADIGNRCVLHCHILAHEDNGAMSWIDVLGNFSDTKDIKQVLIEEGEGTPKSTSTPPPAPTNPLIMAIDYSGTYKLTDGYENGKQILIPDTGKFRMNIKGTDDPKNYTFDIKISNSLASSFTVNGDDSGTMQSISVGRVRSTRMLPTPPLRELEHILNRILPTMNTISYSLSDSQLRLLGEGGELDFEITSSDTSS
jgi:hypothetical protein